MTIANPETLRKAAEYLSGHDPILRPVIERSGPCTIEPHQGYYRELVESIIGQQLSVLAARSIRQKFLNLFGGSFPSPQAILDKSVEELRSCGLSAAKANYVRDLARHVVDGKVRFNHLDRLTNDEVITELTDIKGVGQWTAHMFLIFLMGRLDILPIGDLGIKNGVRALYGLKELPSPAQIEKIAKQYHWHPYESVASWYVWESLDNKPKD